MSPISIRLNKEENELIHTYAKAHNISVSELFRNSVIEKIEDEYDLHIFEKALAEHKKDLKTYTLDEVEQELGLV